MVDGKINGAKNSGERPVTTAQLVKKLNSDTKINSSNPA
jgi:hypothetical protein